jgi:spore germination protein GerM
VDTLKVPKAEFEAAIRALLKAPPTPLADIPKKRETKAKAKRPAKKR